MDYVPIDRAHDVHNPLSQLAMLEAANLAADMHCIWCEAEYCAVPMSGTAWGVETFHRPECPEHEDNQPAAEWGGDHADL